DTHQFYISFTTLLKNFDREDLETLWKIVRDRFSTSKPTNFSDEYLLLTLKTMFEEPDGQDAIWRNQKSVHGLALEKKWKLLTSCDVHVITLSTVQLFLLVERRIPCGLKPKEETFQVILDALALTPCYPAFVITTDVPEVYMHQSMIGSLMYLTASRPDIMFAVCACARKVTPKECHLHAVKRIFRYLKGHPKLGLWYPKESPFDLVAYSDNDYGGATQDRK
nr:putative ribonuclease H-like domain-containing protein [Tanacetum cinerariifolium]